MSDVNAEKVISAFVALRDKKAEINRLRDAEIAEVDEKMQKCKVWLMRAMESVGSDQLKGKGGVAFRQLKRMYSAGDWPQIWAYVKENDRFDMLQKRLGEKALTDFLEESGTLPPGISMHQEYEIVIRRG